MTDIQGNYNISYNNGIEPKKAQKDCQSPKEVVDCNDKLQLTNLNDSPAAYKADLIKNGCDEKMAGEKARMLSRMLMIESI